MARLTVKATFGIEGETALQRCRLTVQPDSTVQSLKAEVLKSFGWESELNDGDIALSLNKRDSVGADDAKVLDCGVCGGDILWVLPPEGHPRIQTLPRQPQALSETADLTGPSQSTQETYQAEPTTENRDCYESPIHALKAVLRRACLQSGLECDDSLNASPLSQTMNHWSYALTEASLLPQFGVPSDDKAEVQVACLPMGAYLMLCAAVKRDDKDDSQSVFGSSTHIPIQTYFQPTPRGWTVEREGELMTKLKTMVCVPAMIEAAHVLGRVLRWSLTALPEEVVLSILYKSDFKSVISVGMTCRCLRSTTASEALWQHLYTTNFNKPVEETRLRASSVKELFKMEWELQKRGQTRDRAISMDMYPYPVHPTPPIPYLPQFPSDPGFPGIIGGDADRLPLPRPRHQDIPSLFGPRRTGNTPWRLI